MLKLLSQPNNVINTVSYGGIERDYSLVGGADLQVYFRATFLFNERFNGLHHGLTISLALPRRLYCQVIDPASMSFVAAHDSSYNCFIDKPDKKKIRIDFQFPFNVPGWIVLRDNQAAFLPKIYYIVFVSIFECFNFHSMLSCPYLVVVTVIVSSRIREVRP